MVAVQKGAQSFEFFFHIILAIPVMSQSLAISHSCVRFLISKLRDQKHERILFDSIQKKNTQVNRFLAFKRQGKTIKLSLVYEQPNIMVENEICEINLNFVFRLEHFILNVVFIFGGNLV